MRGFRDVFCGIAMSIGTEPESTLRIESSGSFSESSRKTLLGFRGAASFMARSLAASHQRATLPSISSRQERSAFRLRRGMRARRSSSAGTTRGSE
ncbi:MAG: hypothetical protein AVDCRST_MAG25-911 [uncultured Rubrobacteraceae bacterium]|uniref:Uncharacterized protein n=1 Tax=uncultured Rubrobacteraceae bacterium TaxID=349277 RepID=A0A6J4RBW4_9ACTN|nr:MAG: hypothetical protein AVDCRST_MAG25-911 [uncultured Rubrobacteraceae bacterium]